MESTKVNPTNKAGEILFGAGGREGRNVIQEKIKNSEGFEKKWWKDTLKEFDWLLSKDKKQGKIIVMIRQEQVPGHPERKVYSVRDILQDGSDGHSLFETINVRALETWIKDHKNVYAFQS